MPAEFVESMAILVQFRLARFKGDRFFRAGDGLIPLPQFGMASGERVEIAGFGEVGFFAGAQAEFEGPGAVANRLIRAAGPDPCEIVHRFGEIGILVKRRQMIGDRLFPFALFQPDAGTEMINQGIPGIQLDGGREIRDRFLPLAQIFAAHAVEFVTVGELGMMENQFVGNLQAFGPALLFEQRQGEAH